MDTNLGDQYVIEVWLATHPWLLLLLLPGAAVAVLATYLLGMAVDRAGRGSR